jgi:tagatose 1,6-diphosphate aldolase
MDVSAGKLRGMMRLADPSGRFKMVAVDQRPPMIKALTELRGTAPERAEVGDAKRRLTRALARHGSAVLIDPDYGFPVSTDVIPADRGLLLTLEDFRFEEDAGGRRSRVLDDWSVAKIKRAGADGVKLLLWYRPDASREVLEHQQAFVAAVGEACRRYDIVFLLELLVFPFKGSAGHTLDYAEDPAKRPELVLQSLQDFADPAYRVDIYKLESPLPASALPDPDGPGAAAAQAWFDRLGAAIDRPWVMLSAGAGMDAFRRVLAYAYRADAHGYLAGRAIWWEAFKRWPDTDAMERELAGSATAYMAEINGLTDAQAKPWTTARIFGAGPALADRDGFWTRYPDFEAQPD